MVKKITGLVFLTTVILGCQGKSSDVGAPKATSSPQPATQTSNVTPTTGCGSTTTNPSTTPTGTVTSPFNLADATPSPTPSPTTTAGCTDPTTVGTTGGSPAVTDADYALLIKPQALVDCESIKKLYNRCYQNDKCDATLRERKCMSASLDMSWCAADSAGNIDPAKAIAKFGTSGAALRDALNKDTAYKINECGIDDTTNLPIVITVKKTLTAEGYASILYNTYTPKAN